MCLAIVGVSGLAAAVQASRVDCASGLSTPAPRIAARNSLGSSIRSIASSYNERMEGITIDGFGPLPVVRPESVAELCDLVKQQRAKKEAIYPIGGRTMLDFGLPPTKPGVAVDMTALNR